MPNWCCNYIKFVSKDREAIADLHNRILDNYKKNMNTVIDLMYSYNFTEHDINLICSKGDYFDLVDKELSYQDKHAWFSCSSVSRWEPNMGALEILLKERYGDKIAMYYQSEEDGDDIFVYRDQTGVWMKDRYKIDYCLDGEYDCEYAETYEQLVNLLKKHFPKADTSVFASPVENEQSVRDAYEAEGGEDGDEFYFNLHVFQPVTDYGYSYYQYKRREAA